MCQNEREAAKEKSIYNGGIKDYISRLRSNTTETQQRKNLRASKSDKLIPLLTVLFELDTKKSTAQTQHQLVKKPLDGQTHYFVWSDGRYHCRHFDQTHQGRDEKTKIPLF